MHLNLLTSALCSRLNLIQSSLVTGAINVDDDDHDNDDNHNDDDDDDDEGKTISSSSSSNFAYVYYVLFNAFLSFTYSLFLQKFAVVNY